LYEEALHIQFYLTLLDTYIPDHAEREAAFDAVRNIPSIASKARFCEKWIDSIRELGRLNSREDRRRFLLNLLCFASCVEGLFFFGAFAYVYYLRSKGMLHGLADGTAWVFRDECSHMSYAFEVAKIATSEEPELMDDSLRHALGDMMREAVDCETEFAADLLSGGISGLTARDMRTYIEYCAGQRLVTMGLDPIWKVKNPFPFMELQGTQELSNFFERRVAAYQVGVTGTVELDRDF
jgi:ribonucleoside-diphosphate reductase beta chain